jgi:hypothetical protein
MYRLMDELDDSDAIEYDDSKYVRVLAMPQVTACVPRVLGLGFRVCWPCRR